MSDKRHVLIARIDEHATSLASFAGLEDASAESPARTPDLSTSLATHLPTRPAMAVTPASTLPDTSMAAPAAEPTPLTMFFTRASTTTASALGFTMDWRGDGNDHSARTTQNGENTNTGASEL